MKNEKQIEDIFGFKEPKKEKEEGLIPILLRKFRFKKQFTKKEIEELEKIKKQTFLFEMRKYAHEEGIKMAKEETERNKRRFKNE